MADGSGYITAISAYASTVRRSGQAVEQVHNWWLVQTTEEEVRMESWAREGEILLNNRVNTH